jgi:hypothetical protein
MYSGHHLSRGSFTGLQNRTRRYLGYDLMLQEYQPKGGLLGRAYSKTRSHATHQCDRSALSLRSLPLSSA